METCYHCGHSSEKAHFVTFYTESEEQNELLCSECYAEWLESIKG